MIPAMPSWEGEERVGLVATDENEALSRIGADLRTELGCHQIVVRPVASSSPTDTLEAVLRLPRTDVGIVQADALAALPEGSPRERLRYIAKIGEAYLHLVARDGIGSLHDLDGRKVNLGPPGSSSDLSGRLVFDRLGIRPVFTGYDAAQARERLSSGEIDAAFFAFPRLSGLIRHLDSSGLRMLSIPREEALASTYRAAVLTAADYPNLIEEEEPVQTLAVDVLLAVYDWPQGSRGYRRLERFTHSLYRRMAALRQPGHHFDWAELGALPEGAPWRRFQPAAALDDSLRSLGASVDDIMSCGRS
jgi:hypothetical protein